MTYRTILGSEVQVTSRDIRLTRGRTVREHTVVGYGFTARVIEDRMTRLCDVYTDGRLTTSVAGLTQAYRFLGSKAANLG